MALTLLIKKELLNEWKAYFNTLLNKKSDMDAAAPAPAETDASDQHRPPLREMKLLMLSNR